MTLNNPIRGHNNRSNDLHIYVSDLLILSVSFEEHLLCLRFFFLTIYVWNDTQIIKIYVFTTKNEVSWSGHIIISDGTSMDPSKLLTIYEFPQPRNKKELQAFIGFVNYYRKFTNRHALDIRSLINLI